jgi:spermidine/putrescine transport system ATP-binding protein
MSIGGSALGRRLAVIVAEDSCETCDVEFHDVTRSYANVVAVDRLNLKVRCGEFFSLLGPSGCGKTTTLRMIAGFEEPTQGEIMVCGEKVTGIPPYRRNVNTVFQDYALFPHLNVWDNVEYGLKRAKVPKEERRTRVNEALDMVEMQTMKARKPTQMSGGQQQRVALARALVNQPTVLLLDEPLGALDAKLRKAMQLELKRLQREVGITFIYVTHDQEEALTMSDRIAIMSKGRIEQIASPSEIYENPSTAFVANFIGVSNVFPATVRSITADVAECESDEGMRILVQPGRHDVREGQRVGIVVRPEKLLITAQADAAELVEDRENVYSGVIKAVIYIGSVTQFVVAIDGKHLVQVLQQNLYHSERREWHTEQEVNVSFWAMGCALITDVEKGLAQKDLMGEVVRRF